MKHVKLQGTDDTSACSTAARANMQNSVYFYPLFYKVQSPPPEYKQRYCIHSPKSIPHHLLVTRQELCSTPVLELAPKFLHYCHQSLKSCHWPMLAHNDGYGPLSTIFTFHFDVLVPHRCDCISCMSNIV